ncbi:MAG: 3-dehydroquinate synthase [Porticoccaceae bacterium]|nr:3-dehydroquinate synthase [Porticoccaceae bacterium]
MKTLKVDLDDRSYPIYIGADLLGVADLLLPHIRGGEVMVVSNETIAPLYLQPVLEALSGLRCDSVILPDGERYKTLDTLNLVYQALLEKRHSRKTTLVALGGGVVGDMTGFAAASYQRGVNFIQIPTTLLSQVDSSVGGKTGVNHALGKNMIGAFHQPVAVIADVGLLDTLPPREFSAGLAEVIKYGLIADPDFFQWLQDNMSRLMARDRAALIYAVEVSCANKARVVAADERESGLRAILNLGHTFGHAIETEQNYQGLLHGEAVAVGMLMAADLSQRMGALSGADVQGLKRLLTEAGLPVQVPSGMTVAEFHRHMAVDKKVADGIVRLVLLRSIGDAYICSDYDAALLEALLASYCTV